MKVCREEMVVVKRQATVNRTKAVVIAHWLGGPGLHFPVASGTGPGGRFNYSASPASSKKHMKLGSATQNGVPSRLMSRYALFSSLHTAQESTF
jgi:hypothetical protein